MKFVHTWVFIYQKILLDIYDSSSNEDESDDEDDWMEHYHSLLRQRIQFDQTLDRLESQRKTILLKIKLCQYASLKEHCELIQQCESIAQSILQLQIDRATNEEYIQRWEAMQDQSFFNT